MWLWRTLKSLKPGPSLPPSRLRQVVPTSGPIRGSTTVTVCGRNFGFDKTESFKTSLVTVEVGGAPCKLPRQDYVNRCVVCVWLLFRSGCSRREVRGSSGLRVPHLCNLQNSSREGASSGSPKSFCFYSFFLLPKSLPRWVGFGDGEPSVTSQRDVFQHWSEAK